MSNGSLERYGAVYPVRFLLSFRFSLGASFANNSLGFLELFDARDTRNRDTCGVRRVPLSLGRFVSVSCSGQLHLETDAVPFH